MARKSYWVSRALLAPGEEKDEDLSNGSQGQCQQRGQMVVQLWGLAGGGFLASSKAQCMCKKVFYGKSEPATGGEVANTNVGRVEEPDLMYDFCDSLEF